jgi:hypothetical protein
MKIRFLNRPDPPGPISKGRTEKSAGAPAGLPPFLNRGVQAKLKTGQPGDEYERQADRVAEAVVSGETAPSVPAQKPAAPGAISIPAADFGTPLESGLRRQIEPAVDADLSHVRVHDSEADRELAGGMGARAFAHGQHIWMGPGESGSDVPLMAHEAAHVVQQASGPAAPLIQKQPQQQQAADVTGTPAQLAKYVATPAAETDAGLRAAITMLNRYSSTVNISRVEFRVWTVTASYVGTGLMETGSSHWEGTKPVIELPQENYDTIAQHLTGGASVAGVHDVIRTVGHEMYHLYRERTGNQSNPIKPLFGAEVARRMEELHQNWVKFAQDPGAARELGVPRGKQVTKWEDIPEDERKKIETGAADTAYIRGLYEQTAYLVEETYVKMEEVSYIRVQQKAETGDEHPSRASLSELAKLLYRFNTALDNSVNAADFMTADLVTKTRVAMLDYLRKRYPHRADPRLDSFEVVFYLTAINFGGPPHYDSEGALTSALPPGARVP